MSAQGSTQIRRLAWGGAAVLGLLVVVACVAALRPWFNAANTPVRLVLGAPTQTDLALGFEADGSVPLVPTGEGEYRWDWLTELPARPQYDLRLQFGDAPASVQLHSIEVTRLARHLSTQVLPLEDLAQAERYGVQVERGSNGVWMLHGIAGGWIDIAQYTPAPASDGLGEISLAVWIILMVSIGLIGFGLRFPWRIDDPLPRLGAGRFGNWPLLAFWALGTVLHLNLVWTAMVSFWPADSTSYTMKAVVLAEEGHYDSGTHEYELNRLPGYPLFLAAVWQSFGWELDTVVRMQALLFCLACGLLALALRRRAHPWLLGPALLLALLSPAAVWASRQIATESLFMSCWIVGIAAWFQLWRRRDGLGRWLWLGAFSCLTAYAVAVRPNGILLLAFPGCLAVGAVWRWACTCLATRSIAPITAKRVALQTLNVLLPFIVTGAFLLGWSYRNHLSRGLAKPTDLGPIVGANAPFYGGWLDVRALPANADGGDTAWLIQARRAAGFAFHGWAVRNHYFRTITDEYRNISNASISELVERMEAFNASQRAAAPWQLRAAARLRTAHWGLFFPKGHAHSLDTLQMGYAVDIAPSSDAYAASVSGALTWALRDTDRQLRVEAKRGSGFIRDYNRMGASPYPWIYRLLLSACSGLFVLAIWRGHIAQAAIAMPFYLNLLLNSWLEFVVSRYVQILDFSLWMSAALIMSIWLVKNRYGPTWLKVSKLD